MVRRRDRTPAWSTRGPHSDQRRENLEEPAVALPAVERPLGRRKKCETGVKPVAWDSRGYYYRMTRSHTDGRFVRRYFGTGLRAKAVENFYAEREERRRAERKAVREAHDELLVPIRVLDELDRAARVLTDAVLFGSGFCRHKRQWRWHGPARSTTC